MENNNDNSVKKSRKRWADKGIQALADILEPLKSNAGDLSEARKELRGLREQAASLTSTLNAEEKNLRTEAKAIRERLQAVAEEKKAAVPTEVSEQIVVLETQLSEAKDTRSPKVAQIGVDPATKQAVIQPLPSDREARKGLFKAEMNVTEVPSLLRRANFVGISDSTQEILRLAHANGGWRVTQEALDAFKSEYLEPQGKTVLEDGTVGTI